MSRSEQQSAEFYRQLGSEGLAARTTPTWDLQILEQVQAMLKPGQRILDLGCGYGRIAVPLAKVGYPVVGLDLSSILLQAARTHARHEGADLGLVCATMRAIPLPAGSIDVVFCLWTAFNELLDRNEQLAAVREVWRVLAPGGWALFEGPLYAAPTQGDIASGHRHGRGFRITRGEVSGFHVHVYRHDEASLRSLVRSAGISSYRIHTGSWAGRERLFLRLGRKRGSA
jgi:SAM-dependent methyltransferase